MNEVVRVRVIMAIVWAFILSLAISYVLTSMGGEPFNITPIFAVAAFILIAVIVLGDGVIKEND